VLNLIKQFKPFDILIGIYLPLSLQYPLHHKSSKSIDKLPDLVGNYIHLASYQHVAEHLLIKISILDFSYSSWIVVAGFEFHFYYPILATKACYRLLDSNPEDRKAR